MVLKYKLNKGIKPWKEQCPEINWREGEKVKVGEDSRYRHCPLANQVLSPAQVGLTPCPSSKLHKRWVPSPRLSGSSVDKSYLRSARSFPMAWKCGWGEVWSTSCKCDPWGLFGGNKQVILQGSFSGATLMLFNEGVSEGPWKWSSIMEIISTTCSSLNDSHWAPECHSSDKISALLCSRLTK